MINDNKENHEKIEKYPQIILGTDNVYQVLIAPGVEVKFNSTKAIEDFFKDKNFIIKGKSIAYYEDRKELPKKEFVNLLSRI